MVNFKKDKKYYILGGIIAVILLFGGYILSNSNKMEVVIETNQGKIVIELYPDKSPITVGNFLQYVNNQGYDNTVFHRVINGFMIQGGGFMQDGSKKNTESPIKLESNNGLTNKRGSIAMARTNVPDSATNQFFINTNDNDFLDYGVRDEGYAVFGQVISGMDIIDKIQLVETTTKFGMSDWPVEDVVIKKVYLR